MNKRQDGFFEEISCKKRPMKNIVVFCNIEKDENIKFAMEIIEYIKQHGGHANLLRSSQKELNSLKKRVQYYNQWIDKIMESGDSDNNFNKFPINIEMTIDDLYNCNYDCIISLGGDGTLLGIARDAAYSIKKTYDDEIKKYDTTPILGINLGTLGYLTCVERKDAFKALDFIFKGQYKLEERLMLKANIRSLQEESICNNNEIKENDYIALNDICIKKTKVNKMVKLKVIINDEEICTYVGDGLIISTPTGSTAYNLSAGGPILKPDAKAIVITPICPHSMSLRPLVVSEQDEIKIQPVNANEDVFAYMDTQLGRSLKNNDILIIKKAIQHTILIKTNELSFYDILKGKML